MSALFSIDIPPPEISRSIWLSALYRIDREQQEEGQAIYRRTFVERDLAERGLIEPVLGSGAIDVTVNGLTKREWRQDHWYVSRITEKGRAKLKAIMGSN